MPGDIAPRVRRGSAVIGDDLSETSMESVGELRLNPEGFDVGDRNGVEALVRHRRRSPPVVMTARECDCVYETILTSELEDNGFGWV